MKRRLLLPAVLFLTLPASAGGSGEQHVLALLSRGTIADVVRLDPLSLQPVTNVQPVPVGLHDLPWAMSPDRSTLALGSGRTQSLVFVDLRSMKSVGRLRTGFTTALAWPVPERLLLVEAVRSRARVVVIDAASRRVLSRRVIGRGNPLAAALTGDGLAFLFAPQGQIGTPRLVVLDAEGRARRVALRAISAGWARRSSPSGLRRTWYRSPGLAVDAEAGHAYVVTAAAQVVDIDLATLHASYHEVGSLRARAAGDRSPASATRTSDGGNQLTSGTQRQAHWLGDGLIAISGRNDRVVRDPSGHSRQTDEPAGLSVIDTRDWTSRSVAKEARWFHATNDLILAHATPARRPGTALTAFTHGGTARFRLELPSVSFAIQSAGDLVYLGLGNEYRSHPVTVIDTHTGTVAGTPRAPGWLLLVSPTQPQFCWCDTGQTVG